MLKVKLVGSYQGSHLRTGGQHCLSHKNLSFSHVLTNLIPIYRPLPQNTYQDSLYFVLHRLAVKRRKTEIRRRIVPILCLTAREKKGTAMPGRGSRTVTVGRASPRSEAPARGRQFTYRGGGCYRDLYPGLGRDLEVVVSTYEMVPRSL